MPESYSRIEIHVSEEDRKRLETLKKEMSEKLGRPVSMNRFVNEIIRLFLDRSAKS